MKILLCLALSALMSTAHDSIRHRQLKCIKKGAYCAGDPDNCCGKSVCGDGNICCIPDGIKGCDGNEQCCNPLSSCIDSMCGEATDDTAGGRQCGIHGEECEVLTGNSNSCCGSTKYSCDLVKDLDGLRCCMEVGSKGCSSESHCCGSLSGNYCLESRCVDADGNYDDETSPGGRNCGLKGDECTSSADCCGSQKYDCIEVCCIKSGLNGCEDNAHCCSGNCDTSASLCL